eukprot:gene35533-46070_t
MNGKISLRQALSGLTLKVAIAPSEMMTVPTNSSPPSGFMANILKEVCYRGGFNVSFVHVNGSLYNSYDELLLQNLPSSDIFASDSFTDTLQRRESGITFSSKILDESPVLVTLQTASSKATLNFWSFLHPFEYLLWAVVAALIFFNGIVHWVIQEDDEREDGNNKSFLKCCYLSFIGMANSLVWVDDDNRSQVFLNSGYAFSFLVIVACYCANMASIFVYYSSFSITYSTPFVDLPTASSAYASICITPNALSRSVVGPYKNIRKVFVPEDPVLGPAAA